MQPPPRLPNGLFPPELAPRWPTHGGAPQDGQSYQVGDPGTAIGTVQSCNSSFGRSRAVPSPDECTFIGSEGLARATSVRFEVFRFADAASLIVCPQTIHLKNPNLSTWTYTWLDGHHRPVFQTTDAFFGVAAEFAFSMYMLPRCTEAMKHGQLRFWTGGPGYVHPYEDRVEVQQLGRRDVVPPRELTVSEVDHRFELVLRAPQLYEARFLVGEVLNEMLLVALLKRLGAKKG